MGRDTPARDITSITLEIKLSLWIPVYTPNITPVIIAINADTKTNSKVAGILSAIKSETSLFNW